MSAYSIMAEPITLPAAPATIRARCDAHPSRRRLFRLMLTAGWALPFAGALVAMLRRVQASSAPLAVTIPPDVPAGLSVLTPLVIHRGNGDVIRAFSGRCTHLGCQIDRVIDNEAVCPCHGSRYRPDGTVSAGPAARSLTPLRVERDELSGGWIARGS